MRVFLTGATGYLGDRIARELMAQDHQVTALVRDPLRAAALAGIGVDLVPGDLLQEASWTEALSRADAVVHTAALVKAWGPEPSEYDAVNVDGTEALVEASLKAGIKRIVVTGSLFALGPSEPESLRDESALAAPPGEVNAANDYARSKSLISRRLYRRQQEGAPVVQVFPTVLVGPGPWGPGNSMAVLITRFAHGKVPGLVGTGDQVWNFVGVRDAALGHVLALERGASGGNYILGGENWSQRRFFEFVAMELDRKPLRRSLGLRLPLLMASLAERWGSLTGRTPFLTQGEVILSSRPWAFSGDRARRDLGFRPEPLEGVLRETIAWLRDEIWPRGRHHG